MKILFSLLIIPIFFLNTVSQNTFLTSNYKKKYEKVKIYYGYVNKAEEKIMKGQYSLASKCYTIAFKAKTPFLQDLKNALEAELNAGKEYDVILNLLKIKMSKMLYRQTKDEFINDIKNDSVFQSLSYIDTLVLSLKTANIKTLYNRILSNKLDLLIKRDQQARIKYDNTPEQTIKLNKTDSINLIKLLHLYNKYGSINENIVGMKGMLAVDMILTHNSKKNRKVWFSKIKEEVLKGDFNNRIFADIIDNYNYGAKMSEYGARLGHELYNKFLFEPLSNKKAVTVNNRRHEIFLEDYMSAIKKLVWQWRNKQKGIFTWKFYPTASYIWIEKDATKNDKKKYLIQQKEIIEQKKNSNTIFFIYNPEK